jgi:VIT1/CCC1 family predicted Fe2+/Mn2+ transporter
MTTLPRVSFGSTSGIVTSMGLIVGLDMASASRTAIVGGLLIVAIADNITDSLSIHIYQESERLEARPAFLATLGNFVTRLVVSMTFVVLVLALPLAAAVVAAMAWGLALLAALTWLVARRRGVSVPRELWKHLGAAIVVISVSRIIGKLILAQIG